VIASVPIRRAVATSQTVDLGAGRTRLTSGPYDLQATWDGPALQTTVATSLAVPPPDRCGLAARCEAEHARVARTPADRATRAHRRVARGHHARRAPPPEACWCRRDRHATLAAMTGVAGVLIKLGVRFLVFGLVFVVAARKNPKVVMPNKWATPLIALVFAALNTGLYWALTPVLNLATLGALGFVMPLVANTIFLLATVRIFQRKKWLEIQGVRATLWMAVILTVAHGACWLGLDYLPKHF